MSELKAEDLLQIWRQSDFKDQRTINYVLQCSRLDLQSINSILNLNPGAIRNIWELIYANYFNQSVDFSNLIVPPSYDPNKHFGIVVAEGIRINHVVAVLRELFAVDCYLEDLDSDIKVNDRVADKDYLVFFDKKPEFQVIMMPGITILERLLLDLAYLVITDEHLDGQDYTLCLGSRTSVGRIPTVSWGDFRFRLSIYHQDLENTKPIQVVLTPVLSN